MYSFLILKFIWLMLAATTPISCLFILLYGGFLLLFSYDQEKRVSVCESKKDVKQGWFEETLWVNDDIEGELRKSKGNKANRRDGMVCRWGDVHEE